MSTAKATNLRRDSFALRLALALFFLPCCFLLDSCSSTGHKKTGPEAQNDKLQIQRVVDVHNELLRDRNEALKKANPSGSEASRIYAEYGQELKAIDMTTCPVDFQVAFLEYIHSIEDVSSKMAKEPEGLKWQNLLGLLEFNPLAVVRVISEVARPQKERSAINKEIQSSIAKSQERWRKIELISVQYGVRLQTPERSRLSPSAAHLANEDPFSPNFVRLDQF